MFLKVSLFSNDLEEFQQKSYNVFNMPWLAFILLVCVRALKV